MYKYLRDFANQNKMWQNLLKVTQILSKPNPKSSSLAKKGHKLGLFSRISPF